ncbi:hypothetical protein ACEYYB_08920 [Paracoccus sp. p4-l81]|uniref:hypothetical protein n=1 Tax=Paracoccus sp. p4-l81 TaxID=3342806 RepID=UPI0035B98841
MMDYLLKAIQMIVRQEIAAALESGSVAKTAAITQQGFMPLRHPLSAGGSEAQPSMLHDSFA